MRLSELNLKSPHKVISPVSFPTSLRSFVTCFVDFIFKLMLVGTAKQELQKQAKLETEYRDNMAIEKVLERERLAEMAIIEEERATREAERRR